MVEREVREAHEVISSIMALSQKQTLGKVCLTDIDFKAGLPYNTCSLLLKRKTVKSRHLARLIEVERLFLTQ